MKIIDTTRKGLILPSKELVYATSRDLAGVCDQANKPVNPVKLYTAPPPGYAEFLQNVLAMDLSAGLDPDVDRYNDILRGKAREKLKKFIDPGEMIGKKGDDLVSIPVPRIRIPRFRQGTRGQSGVGQGDGQIGQPIAGQPNPGDGNKAGSDPGDHIREELIPMSRSEIAQFLIEDLGLPNLIPKGQHHIKKEGIKWTTKSKVGLDWLLQETVMNAITRAAVEIGEDYDLDDPEQLEAFLDNVTIEDSDIVYQSWTTSEKPETSAVIIYMMDVSGSMTDDQKKWVRRQAWYLSTIIQYSYGLIRAQLRNEVYQHSDFGRGIEEVFIIHDAQAKEVSEEEFYTTRESGGTRISSAYKLGESIIKQRYNPATWNIYMFHFSDGDNWGEDSKEALDALKRLEPQINEFGYVQTSSPYGSGDHIKKVENEFGDDNDKVRTAKIENGEDDEFRQVTIDLLEER